MAGTRMGDTTRRVAALWCPDWPAAAAAADADLPPGHPIAVLSANRVIACSAPARVAGIRRGMRKRQAQSLCPEMTVVTADDHRDGRMFEPVASAVADLAPTMEVLRPGLLVIPASGAARFHGGEEVFAEQLVDRIAVSGMESQVGIADQLFTAVLAAHRGELVPAGGDRDHLAALPIAELAAEPSLCGPGRDDLVDLLRRLGLTSIGAFAALSATEVGTRFGADASAAHRQARGEPGRPPSAQALPADLSVEQICDPPIDRIDAAAFAGRRLAEVLHRHLRARSVACTILTVEAITELGQRHSRTWRCAQPLTPAATADRVRWQLEGWMTGGRSRTDRARPDSPIGMLRLVPAEVVDAGALQQTLTAPELPGGAELSERARRSMERVQGLLGGDAVRIPVRSGGRGPFDQITLVALDEEPTPEQDPAAPWPGRVPHPVPTVISESPIELVDLSGQPVRVTDRGAFTTEPTTVRLPDRRGGWELRWWAGPWPTGMETGPTGMETGPTGMETGPTGMETGPTGMETGTGGAASPISARAQVLLDDSRALLLAYRSGGWMVEGIYE